MGIQHFSGLFVLLCVGVTGALLSLAGEHAFYRLVLPHIRRRQKLRYWLHTSQKIHRALNMTYEDVKNKRATAEKSGNVQKAPTQPPVPPPPPPPLGATATWSTEGARAPPGQKDTKRVHFNLETLNSRRLLSHPGPGEEPAAGGRVCENGGPAAPPPVLLAPPPAPVREGELEELQERIERFRAQLREALARRAELQTSLAKQRADPPTTTDGPSPGPAPIANTAPSADSSETR